MTEQKVEESIKTNIKTNPLGTTEIPILLKKFAVPSIIAMLVSALYNIVDQFFIGRSIGELGNAATNIAFPLTTSCVALALLFGIGGASAFNLTMGKGDSQKAIYYIGNAATMLFCSGLILAIIVETFLTPLLLFFGSPQNVLEYATTYTRITAIGFPFLILATGGGHLVRADGSPQLSMTFQLVGAIINTILDPLFIFGFHMGMAGAAAATIIGQIISAGLISRYLSRYKTVPLKKEHLLPKREYTGFMMSLGAASFLNQMAIMIVQITLNNSLKYYGEKSIYGEAIPLACVGIITKMNQIYFSIVIGLSQSIQPIASFNYGASNYERVKKVYKLAIRYGTIVSIAAFILFQVFPRQLIAIFGSGSEEYFTFAIRYFRIYLFMTFLNAVQPISSTFFTAIGMPKKGIFLSLTRQTIFLLPLIIIFPLFMGIDGIMYAGPIADGMAVLVSALMIILEFKKMDRLISDQNELIEDRNKR